MTLPQQTGTWDSRTALRNAWQMLGRPGALSLRSALLFIPAGTIGPLAFDRVWLGGPLVKWLGVAVVAELALLASFAILQRVVHPRGARRSRPYATTAAIIVAAAFRGLSLSVSAVAFGLTTDWEFAYRIGGAGIFTVATLLVIGVVVSSYDEHHAVVADLEAQRSRLVTMRANAATTLEETTRKVLDEVRDTIGPHLVEIDAALDAIARGGEPSLGAQALRRFIDDEVRPLSHRLGTESMVAPITDTAEEAPRRAKIPLPDRVLVGRSIKPVTTGILCVAASIPAGFRTLSTPTAIAFILLFSALCMVLLLIARSAVGRLVMHPFAAWAIIAAVYAATGPLSIYLLTASGVPTPPGLLVPALMFCVIVGSAQLLYDLFTARQESTQEQLREIVAELQTEISRLHQGSWVARRQLAYVMHGRLQATLHAAAIRLSSTPVTRELVEGVRRDVAEAVRQLETPLLDEPPLADVLQGIADLWRGSCTVDYAVSSETARLLAAHPASARCIREITQEAVGNAIHHGGAEHVRVTVEAAHDMVAIDVSDDGRGWDPDSAPGLGTQMFDDLCTDWVAAAIEPGTRFTAHVPVTVEHRINAG